MNQFGYFIDLDPDPDLYSSNFVDPDTINSKDLEYFFRTLSTELWSLLCTHVVFAIVRHLRFLYIRAKIKIVITLDLGPS